ncbi:hypothetical protein [Paenibacillus hubeiensis]|uniref:hypothetical protein n=1 Tax=Paenibacillus hubeiensis TaxID=3077330 RepID=UPI0031BB5E7A
MGLDYNYRLIIHKDQKERLFRYVQAHGELTGTNSFCLHFDVDSAILKYLEGGYSFRPHYDQDEIGRSLLPGNKARIGAIEYSEDQLDHDPERLRIRFAAVTSDMSLMLQESNAVRSWFVALSKHVDAIITYMDMEAEGQRIIYGNGKEALLEFKEDGFSQGTRMDFVRRMNGFVRHWPRELQRYGTHYRQQEKYSLIIRKEQRAALRQYVENHGRIMEEDELVILVDLDAPIMKYLEDGYGENEYGVSYGSVPQSRKALAYKHIGENLKVSLGGILVVEEEMEGEEDEMIVHFIPQKWKLDGVFSQSLSIRDWFRELGATVQAKLAFQSVWLGEYGHRIIQDQDQPTHVEFTGHYELEVDHFVWLYRMFAEYFEHFADEPSAQEE